MTWKSIHKNRELFSNPFSIPRELPLFPDDYVAFLTELNGVTFDPVLVLDYDSQMTRRPATEDPDTFFLSVLYGSCPGKELDIVRSQQDYWFADLNAQQLVAIGGTESFNEVCISVRQLDFGSVFYWFIPSEPPDLRDLIDDKWRERRLVRLASSFTEFLAKLELYATPYE